MLLIGLVVAGLVLVAYWTGLWWVADHRGLEIADGTMREAYQQALGAPCSRGSPVWAATR